MTFPLFVVLARWVGLVAEVAAFAMMVQTSSSAQTAPVDASLPAPGLMVCVGASVTAGEHVTPAQCYVALLRARVAAAGVALKVQDDGRSGWSTGAFAYNAKAIADHLPADTSLITILLGTNDARTQSPPTKVAAEAVANMTKLIAAYRAKVPKATFVIIAPPTVDAPRLSQRLIKADYGPWSPNDMAAIRVAYRHLAKRLGARFVDLLDVLAPGQTVDGVHPDAAGHVRIADAIWPALAAGPYSIPQPAPGKLVCVGASITQGHGVAAGKSYVDRLRAKAKADGIALAVVGEGRGGWTTSDYLAHAKQVVATVPTDTTVIAFELGINDTKWPDRAPAMADKSSANLKRLIHLYHRRVPGAQLVVLSPTACEPDHMSKAVRQAGFGSQTPARLRAVADAYRVLAGQQGWGFVDLAALPTPGHTVDGLHPNPAGHAQIADAVWAALAVLPPQSPSVESTTQHQ